MIIEFAIFTTAFASLRWASEYVNKWYAFHAPFHLLNS